jgi:hypothetical protein
MFTISKIVLRLFNFQFVFQVDPTCYCVIQNMPGQLRPPLVENHGHLWMANVKILANLNNQKYTIV